MRGTGVSALFASFVLISALASLFWIGVSVRALEDQPHYRTLPEFPGAPAPPAPLVPELHEYIEVMGGCDFAQRGECAVSRAGPGAQYEVVNRLRTGVVLKVGGRILNGLAVWHRVVFDEELRYPERVVREQYVAASDVRRFVANGVQELRGPASTTKHILIDRSEQMLYAYDGDELLMQIQISTGIDLTPTPRGNFTVYKKTPTRYMQGPLPGISEKYYDLPGVPWNLYFTQEGGVIHGAYWHDSFGSKWSNGCVNLPLAEARVLYEWAEIGTPVLVRD